MFKKAELMEFSFKYGGVKMSSADLEAKMQGDKLVYKVGDLTVTRSRKSFSCGAEYSLLHFFNGGKSDSDVISDVFDVDDCFGFDDVKVASAGYCGYYDDGVKIYASEGCNFDKTEFSPVVHALRDGGNRYSSRGGRSSQGYMPFFEVSDGKRGFLMAIGWTGQWHCGFDARNKAVRYFAGVENLSFRLHPQEEVRTASVLLLPFENGSDRAHNEFRKLIRKHFSLLDSAGRSEVPPFCMSSWGGAGEEVLLAAIEKNSKQKLGFEYLWVDAGWYGDYEGSSPSEFLGDWFGSTGDWVCHGRVYPDTLKPVFTAAEKAGMGGVLWLEPERAQKTCRFYRENPDMFIDVGAQSVLLNLAEKKCRDYMLDTVAGFISDYGLKCYRQDFNFDPLPYWEKADENDRKGITQLKYVAGLYEVWDRLLNSFPHLIIDNCSSGGKRLDIETLSRSVPLWRSDVNCEFDFDPESAQSHNIGLSRWLPYHGNGVGKFIDDRYRFRSCHSPALSSNFAGYAEFGDYSPDYEEVRRLIAEYKEVRPLLSKDFYPVFGFPEGDASWAGWEYFDSALQKGVVTAFRRKKCLSDSVTIFLGGINRNAVYEFTDRDSGEKFRVFGSSLISDGFTVTAPKTRTSRLWTFQAVK